MTDEKERTESGDGAEPAESERHESPVAVGEDAAGAEAEVVEVEELRAELDSLNDRHLRLAAEFDNYRKRNERDRQAQAARQQAELVRSLLEVLDDLERVTGGPADASAESLREGIDLVERKFRNLLESAGLEPLESEGRRFDPATMEALTTVPTDDPSQDDHVADVFQRGYRFRDVLVRPARVRVLKYQESDGEE